MRFKTLLNWASLYDLTAQTSAVTVRETITRLVGVKKALMCLVMCFRGEFELFCALGDDGGVPLSDEGGEGMVTQVSLVPSVSLAPSSLLLVASVSLFASLTSVSVLPVQTLLVSMLSLPASAVSMLMSPSGTLDVRPSVEQDSDSTGVAVAGAGAVPCGTVLHVCAVDDGSEAISFISHSMESSEKGQNLDDDEGVVCAMP